MQLGFRSRVPPSCISMRRNEKVIQAVAGVVGLVCLIILGQAVLSAWIPGWNGNVRDGDSGHARNSCGANLRAIQGAKETWILEQNKTTNDIPLDSDLFGPALYIREKPQCMMGGKYTLGKVGDSRSHLLNSNASRPTPG